MAVDERPGGVLQGRVVRLVLIGLGTLAGLWLALGVTVAQIYADTNPELVARVWPGARAPAVLAARLGTAEAKPADRAKARALAVTAVERSPTEVSASRTLGILEALANRDANAQRLFDYSEKLTRRDVTTQLWMIEERARQNDIKGALQHYDRALRTSPDSWQTLFPVLIKATSDPAIEAELAPLLKQRPSWRDQFLAEFVANGESAAMIDRLIRQLGLRAADPLARPTIAAALSRIVLLKDYSRAAALYRAAYGDKADAALVHQGSFERESLLPPFDWALIDQDQLSGVAEPRDGVDGQYALSIYSQDAGAVAQQLLVLPPGQYRLSAIGGELPVDPVSRPVLYLRCAEDQRQLAELRFNPGPTRRGAVAANLTVPAGCAAQWLSIVGGSNLAEPQFAPWIDKVSVVRL